MSDEELRKWAIEQTVMVNAGHNVASDLICREANTLMQFVRRPERSMQDQIRETVSRA